MGFGNYGKSTNAKEEPKYEVKKDFGSIGVSGKWDKRVRLISWNGNEPKFDIRSWSTDENTGDEKMLKGITLTSDEMEKLYTMMKEISEGNEA